jgi:hypothetical protein
MRFGARLFALAVLCAAQSISAQNDQRPNRREILDTISTVESFGRPLRWFGVVDADVFFDSTCAFDLFPNERCFVPNPDPATTRWEAREIASITFPGNTFKTVICPILTHSHDFALSNTTQTPQFDARFDTRTTLTLESKVLMDPSAIDPVTGAPLNGKVEFAFGRRIVARSLNPGERQQDSLQFTRECQAGINRGNVVAFGVPAELWDRLLREPMTLHLNMRGSVRLLEFGSLQVVMRVMGD